MDMEEIFQELILSVGLSVAVCYMVMKLQSRGGEEKEKVETCMESNDGSGKEVLLEGKGEKQSLVYDIGKSKKLWPFSDFFDQLSVENIYDDNVICSSEITSEVVEDAAVLQYFKEERESVGSEKSNSFSDDNQVISDIVDEKVEVESAEIVQERLEILNFYEIESANAEVREAKCEEVHAISSEDGEEKSRDVSKEGDHSAEEEEGLFDDWEGIERTELEKLFGAAVAFVGSKSKAGLIDRDLKIQLYGFHKIAIEGPCQGSQPMALKVSARAKWNSWRKLGNMNREVAMEQYLILLSTSIPEWMTKEETSVKQFRAPSCG